MYFNVEWRPAEVVADKYVAEGWWLGADLDCNSAHFTHRLCEEDGPYPTENAALRAGMDCAREWFWENWPGKRIFWSRDIPRGARR